MKDLSAELNLPFGTGEEGLRKLLAILENSHDGIFITDDRACPIWCNHAYETISGLKAADIMGVSMHSLVAGGLISESATLMALETGNTVTIDQTFKNGKMAIVTSTPIFETGGRISMVVTNVRDISEIMLLKKSLSREKELSEQYRREVSEIRDRVTNTPKLVAEDPATIDLLRIVSRAAVLDTVVLIQGETGSGKEIIAAYIHRWSNRAKESFVRVNCGAIPDNLAESEFFGYERGAFTGANREGKAGLFESANGGTIFLDEIGELPLPIQTKLLRVLQEREVTRIGGSKATKIDVRVIAATNRDLKQEVKAGQFREDLYYRLSVFPVYIPPLRERRLDILKLAENMLEDLNGSYGKSKRLTSGAKAALTAYTWPGNVRELHNVMERAFIMSDENEIAAEDLAIVDNGVMHEPHSIVLRYGKQPEQTGTAWAEPEKQIPLASTIPAEGESLQEQVERFEAKLIENALRAERTLRAAARRLQMDPATLLRRKKKYEDMGLLRKDTI